MKPNRKKFILALSSSRHSKETIRRALDLAKSEDGELVLLHVVEEDTPNKIADYVSDMGFMGDKTADILRKSLLEEYRERGQEEIANLKAVCKEEGIPLTEMLRSGGFAHEVLKAAREIGPDAIVLNKREDRTDLERWVFGSEVQKIRANAPCKVKIIKGR